MIKKVISFMMALIVSFVFVGGVNVSNAAKKPELFVEKTKDIINAEGEKIGKKHEKVYRDIEVTSDGTKIITLTKESEEEFLGEKNKKNSKKVDVIKITKDNEYFINDKKLDKEFLTSFVGTPDNSEDDAPNYGYRGEVGGISYLTFYREINKNYYYLKTYSDADDFMDHAAGTKKIRYSNGNTKVSDFKMYAGQVKAARSDIASNCLELEAVLVATALTWETVIGLIGGIGTAAVLAYNIWDASGDGHDAMANAYSVLNNW